MFLLILGTLPLVEMVQKDSWIFFEKVAQENLRFEHDLVTLGYKGYTSWWIPAIYVDLFELILLNDLLNEATSTCHQLVA